MRTLMVECEVCGAMQEDPDGVTPAGWFMLAQMGDMAGCWDDADEYHFCSMACVKGFSA